MATLALYAESVYRIAPALRNKNLLGEIEQEFEAGVIPEDCATFLSSITQRSDLMHLAIPIPATNKLHLDNPAALAAHVKRTYGKDRALQMVLDETWRHEKGSSLFKFYAGVARTLAEGA